MTLRWRIALVFIIVVGLLLVSIGLWLQAAILRETTGQLTDRMLAETRMLAAIAPAPPWEEGEELSAWAQEMDRQLGARVTLIDEEGRVRADSRSEVSTMEYHADRPERRQALQEGWGSAVRWSDTLGVEMLYLAVPKGEAGAVVRLALPLTVVEAASLELRRTLSLIFLAAACALLLVAPWVARALTEPIERLVAVARRVEKGDLEARAPREMKGELGELARVFNGAVDRLSKMSETFQLEAGRYAAILEQMSDAVVIVDERGRVALANPAFGRLFRVEPEEVAGQYLEQIALNYELSQLLARAFTQRTPQRTEVQLLHPESRTLVGAASPLMEGDDLQGAVALLHDVSDWHRADKVRRDFVANASHELRTPIAGIRALAEALEAGALGDKRRGPEFVRQIVEVMDRLTAILDDMLVLTRVERGQELLRPEWVAARQACEKAIGHVKQRARTAEISLECEVGEGDSIYADPGSLETILTNLLDNAVKYTAPGGEVEVMGRQALGGYELSVRDTGIGIPEQDRERVFERFYRVDKARDRATGGTGLGLAIVKHSMEAHGGRVALNSTMGKGSKFTLFFPNPK